MQTRYFTEFTCDNCGHSWAILGEQHSHDCCTNCGADHVVASSARIVAVNLDDLVAHVAL